MSRISRNFTTVEFIASPTAQQQGISNVPADNELRNIRALVHGILQPLRTSFNLPCIITSGFRSEALNRAVSGAETSQHRTGEAADCAILRNGVRIPTIEIARRAVELALPFDQMILYPNFIHFSLSIDRENRGEDLYHRTYTGERL